MCAPPWNSDAVFSTLIGGAGSYAVTPVDPRFVWGGSYEPGSLIWCSRWITDGGIIECREALAFPGDPQRAVVIRRIIATRGAARVRVMLNVRAGFGKRKMDHLSTADDVWSGRSGAVRLRWSGAGRAEVVAGGGLQLDVDLAEGDHHDLVLGLSEHGLPSEAVVPEPAWAATEYAWAAMSWTTPGGPTHD